MYILYKCFFSDQLLTTYVQLYQITEFHLDSIFKFREDRTLPKEVSLLIYK